MSANPEDGRKRQFDWLINSSSASVLFPLFRHHCRFCLQSICDSHTKRTPFNEYHLGSSSCFKVLLCSSCDLKLKGWATIVGIEREHLQICDVVLQQVAQLVEKRREHLLRLREDSARLEAETHRLHLEAQVLNQDWFGILCGWFSNRGLQRRLDVLEQVPAWTKKKPTLCLNCYTYCIKYVKIFERALSRTRWWRWYPHSQFIAFCEKNCSVSRGCNETKITIWGRVSG